MGHDRAKLEPLTGRRAVSLILTLLMTITQLPVVVGVAHAEDPLSSLQTAKLHYFEGLWEESVLELESLVLELDGDDLLVAHQFLARSYVRIGEEAKAKETFKALLALEPSWRADPEFVPEAERSVFEEALAESTEEGERLLRIDSDPAGARIYIDEELLPEMTPAVIDDVPAGIHHIRLILEEYISLDTLLTVDPVHATELNVTLEKPAGEKGGKQWWLWALGGGAVVLVTALLAGGGGGGGGDGDGVDDDLPGPPGPPSR